MNCIAFETLIALYAEGDLETSRVKDVETHLKACSSCQRFLSDLEASQGMVKDLAAEPLDAASFNVVRQQVMQEVNRRHAARPPWWRFLFPALCQWRLAGAAALAISVALGFLLQRQLWHKPAGSDGADSPTVASAPPVQEKNPGALAPRPPEKMTPKPEQQSSEPGSKQFARRRKTPVLQELVLPVGVQPDAVTEEPESAVEQGSNLEPEPPQPADVTPEPPPLLVIKLITDDPNIVIVWLVDQDGHHN
ncbi:MAG: zf-HC2 domain-containing protein [Acidobacteria bacterium]|nr:zf-HC2 domain-containing protein [Acidobacteriota bacterium]